MKCITRHPHFDKFRRRRHRSQPRSLATLLRIGARSSIPGNSSSRIVARRCGRARRPSGSRPEHAGELETSGWLRFLSFVGPIRSSTIAQSTLPGASAPRLMDVAPCTKLIQIRLACCRIFVLSNMPSNIASVYFESISSIHSRHARSRQSRFSSTDSHFRSNICVYQGISTGAD